MKVFPHHDRCPPTFVWDQSTSDELRESPHGGQPSQFWWRENGYDSADDFFPPESHDDFVEPVDWNFLP